MKVVSDFESGSICFNKCDGDKLRLLLTTNKKGEVNHWFYFGVIDSPKSLTIIIENGMLSRFAKGWYGYKPFISVDNIKWVRCNTAFGVLDKRSISIELDNLPSLFYLAWYPPCTPKTFMESTGFIDYINLIGNLHGDSILITARQHPGETMGSFLLEGLCDFFNSDNSRCLLSKYNVIIVPFVNIEGVCKGMHRTSYEGLDFNFAWFGQGVDKINQIKEFLNGKSIVLYFDIHGDEVSKINYLYYTGKKLKSIKPLLLDLQHKNNLILICRSKVKYVLKVLLKKHKIIFGIRNTVEYIERNRECAGLVYELSAHNTTPEECRIHGKNLGFSINDFLLTK